MMGEIRRVLTGAYEKLGVPNCPRSGEMQNWMLNVCQACCLDGGYIDRLELIWLNECWVKSFDDLRNSAGEARWFLQNDESTWACALQTC